LQHTHIRKKTIAELAHHLISNSRDNIVSEGDGRDGHLLQLSEDL
jgi:hypothetical protein